MRSIRPGIRRPVCVAVFVLAAFQSAYAQNGVFDWEGETVRELYPGIQHAEVRTESPRKLRIECVRIDTAVPGLDFRTTQRAEAWVPEQTETIRQATRDFLASSRTSGLSMAVAVNADAFSPWPAPWNQPTPTNLQGLAIAEGTIVSPPAGTPSLLVHKDGTLSMAVVDPAADLSDIDTAVSGFAFCLEEGRPLPSTPEFNPRTGFGLSEDRRWLTLLVVDGRRHASLGCTKEETGDWLRHFGAHTGINMDGGGSATLAWWDPNDAASEVLNEPVGNGQTWHDKDPTLESGNFRPTERANGNNLGVCVAKP